MKCNEQQQWKNFQMLITPKLLLEMPSNFTVFSSALNMVLDHMETIKDTFWVRDISFVQMEIFFLIKTLCTGYGRWSDIVLDWKFMSLFYWLKMKSKIQNFNLFPHPRLELVIFIKFPYVEVVLDSFWVKIWSCSCAS